MEPPRVRAFVAIQLPVELRDRLEATQARLRADLPKLTASWPKPGNLHLTLRFLGDVEAARLEAWSQRLCQEVGGFGALDLVCAGLGCFPDLKRPRVIWAGVTGPDERLAALQLAVERAAVEIASQPAEKHFHGHVTLARVKWLHRVDAARLAGLVRDAAEQSFGAWRCAHVEVVRSQLSSEGSHYATLARCAL